MIITNDWRPPGNTNPVWIGFLDIQNVCKKNLLLLTFSLSIIYLGCCIHQECLVFCLLNSMGRIFLTITHQTKTFFMLLRQPPSETENDSSCIWCCDWHNDPLCSHKYAREVMGINIYFWIMQNLSCVHIYRVPMRFKRFSTFYKISLFVIPCRVIKHLYMMTTHIFVYINIVYI